MNTRERIMQVALEGDLRRSTIPSYRRLLDGLGLLDYDLSKEVLERIGAIEDRNTRRATVIAVRSVFGWPIKIQSARPRYNLPSEDTLRLALMTSPHEARGLLMMYAGLRIGESRAIKRRDVDGDRLTVNKQVQMLHETGKPTTLAVGPLKSACSDSTVVIPNWLTAVAESLAETAKPESLRESLRRSGKRAGIALNPHMLRHWYATTLIENGVALPVVQRQMRHSDIAGRSVHSFRATPERALTTSSVERTRVTSRQVSVACAGLFLPNTEEEP